MKILFVFRAEGFEADVAWDICQYDGLNIVSDAYSCVYESEFL
jgi:hypothetical protein